MANRSHAKKHDTSRRMQALNRRRLLHQQLERRELMAADFFATNGDTQAPTLISVNPNAGQIFDFQQINELTAAPTELTFRFAGGQQIDPDTLGGIRITSAGGDANFNNGNETVISPGFLGFGETERIVIARFAQSLPDDLYKVEIFGFDQPSAGIVGLRNIEGELFQPADANADREEILFEVELGALVTAVVPQPIETVNGVQVQRRDRIHVYFNSDPLSDPAAGRVTTGAANAPTVVRPEFYQLFMTNETVENTDDAVLEPISVTYDPALNRAVLRFASDLSEWAPVAASGGAATLRLRIGSNEAVPTAPAELSVSGDEAQTGAPGDTFDSARSLGSLFDGAGKSIVIRSEVAPTGEYLLQWPGSPDTPGVREIRRNSQLLGRADTELGIATLYYNFKQEYGEDIQKNRLDNAITEAQRQRVREVLDLYEQHLGVRFVETEDRGLQIVTGDMRAVEQTADVEAGGSLSIFRTDDSDPTVGLLILDAAENWFDGYGLSPDSRPSFFVEALRGVGSLLGIGDMFDRPPGTAAGSEDALDFDLPVEPDFLSQSDITVGQHLFRPEGRDIDMYRFNVSEPGRLTAETFAERLAGSSLLDTSLTLWRRTGSGDADYELVARNDDFYSNDSFVGVELTPGEYFIGVSASGNDSYDPTVEGSGLGGRSEGRYELRLVYRSSQSQAITDTSGSALDGDADGVAGGDYNFWFRTARAVDPTAPASQPRVLFVGKAGNDNSGTGALASPLRTIDEAMSRARSGDIVRLLPHAGADGRFDTLADNLAFEIGRGGVGKAVLDDGENLEVKQGVTLMVDAGAILKLRDAGISVGSSTIDTDRSHSALQVLGTPILINGSGVPLRTASGALVSGRVIFTSYDDEQVGLDTNSLQTTPGTGQWGGLAFRNDVDYAQGRPVHEAEGIFLNYVGQADIRFGGGTAGDSAAVSPIHMSDARPAIKYNIIRNSADAAMSADPNSFAETNFHAPIFQRAELFTSDYGRVGPDLAGNRFVGNSINGLFVRIDTPAAGRLEPMTVSGRFDDADITHVISQVLVLQGTPGGPLLQTQRPDVQSVTVATTSGNSTLAAGKYNYRLTFVDIDGSESLASLPTRQVNVANGRAVRLAALPAAPEGFVGRRLYRYDAALDEYVFVTGLNRSQTSYVDDGSTRGGVLDTTVQENFRPRYDARLSIDPGLVVKFDTSRIEATFGADFYAEGIDGREIVFTSRHDDRYGAGGTFDTNNDGNPSAGGTAPAPADWGGLVFGQGSDASVDFASIQFGGGSTPINGGFAHFNAMEIVQARARVAHTTFANNAAGIDESNTRGGAGFNDSAALFIRGAQPIIVDNVFRDNAGAAISINPDAMNFSNVTDRGRATGELDRMGGFEDNQGPLVRVNRLDNNGINGMVVRPEVLTTEGVWDDTDIVHVVNGDIVAVDHHYVGGLRLESNPSESLVVKFTAGAQLLATGRPLDIDDRIGGTLQIVGQPGFPVVLTSIKDDSVGAGFAVDGQSQNNTDNADATPQPGDWQGIVLDSFANDRNVQIALENEAAISTAAGQNAVPGSAQYLGSLAVNEKSGDENRRLGFTVQGTLSADSDIDVYSFTADSGTEVWIDIDRTTYSLDSVVELIDQNGNILVLSNDSFGEQSQTGALHRDPALAPQTVHSLSKVGNQDGQTESPNPGDAGFRVVLPGAAGVSNVYYVRVRSSNVAPGGSPDQLLENDRVREGRTRGAYQLGIRLRETDEVAGSTVQFAHISYAVNGVDLVSAPLHSPLAGEAGERLFDENGRLADRNGVLTTADPLGNLLSTDRASLTVKGQIGNQSFTINPAALPEEDVDVFRLDLFYDSLEPEITRSDNRYVPLTFDIDYADGLGRVNTSISIYDATGRLILTGRDSNVAGDVGTPLRGVDMQNLSAGSAGVLDAHIGPVELPEGVYYVAVHSDVLLPAPLDQFINPSTSSPLTRVMPINSLRQIASDSLEEGGAFGGFGFDIQQLDFTADRPILAPIFDTDSIVPYSLEDVRLFVMLDQSIAGGQSSTLATFDPFTGVFERTIGGFGPRVSDVAMRGDGELYSYSIAAANGVRDNGTVGNYLNISSQNGAVLSSSDDGLVFRRDNQNLDATENDDSAQLIINAMAFDPTDRSAGDGDRMYVVGNRDTSGRVGEVLWTKNIVYSNVATTGAATNRGSTNANADRNFGDLHIIEEFGPASNKFELGVIDTGGLPMGVDGNGDPILSPGARGNVTGVAVDPDNSRFLYAVDDNGGVYRVDLFRTRTVDRSPGIRPEGTPPPPVTGDYSSVFETTYLGTVPTHADHSASTPQFSGMSLGPLTTENGLYRQTMFATTADGWLYGIEVDNSGSDPQAVPAPIFSAGQSAVRMVYSTGAAVSVRPVGLAFSTLEDNPWHQTRDRDANPGHGVYAPYDRSRQRSTVRGGSSLYFGFEPTANEADNRLEHPEGNVGVLAPGGSHGSVVTRAFNLEDYAAADKPTAYFSYFLETEGVNYTPGVTAMRDSFRVFAAGDDGQWQLVSTNDSFRQLQFDDEFDEHLVTDIPVQETHDNSNSWRQARIDLSPMAGNSQVRLRFDFSTAGAMGFGDSGFFSYRDEIQAIPANRLTDGETLQIFTPDFSQVTFEVDLGYVVDVPSGGEITLGDSIEIEHPGGTQTVVFTDEPAGRGKAAITPEMTSSQVADAVLAALDPAIGAVRFGQGSIGLTNATNVVNSATGSGVVISSTRGVSPGAVPIIVEGDLTADEVVTRLREAFVAGLGTAEATIENFKAYNGRVVLYNHQVFDSGPFGLSTHLPGDDFGDFESSELDRPNPRPGQNNEIEGVYIDDLIIGFAERGEMVINAPTNNLNFVRNPESDPEFEQPERLNEVLTGGYSLEVRTSAEYGVPDDYDPIRFIIDETLGLGRSFDTNDRLDDAVTIVAQPGGEIRDGDTFALTDGTRTLTFEFDSQATPGVAQGNVRVPFDPRTDTAAKVAAAIRNAINSTQVQASLQIRAETGDSREGGGTTSRLVNLFGDNVFVNPSSGRNLKVDLVKEENFQDRVAAQTFPQIPTPGAPVQYVLEPDTLARAYPTQYVNGATDTLVAVGKIGDRATSGAGNITGRGGRILEGEPSEDVDIIKIHLFAGDEIDIDLDAVTTAKGANRLFAPVLRVFGANGNLLANSSGGGDAAPGESVGESFLRFTAAEDGYYYVSVASSTFSSFGEYQLTVRPASDRNDVLYVDYHMDRGDTNRFRDQGQILITSNVISSSSEWGVRATADQRNRSDISQLAGTELPRPGNARLLRNENTDRLLPGAVIANNVVVDGGSGGILFAGDTSPSGTMRGGVPFGRIVNNTVVGRSGTGDIGIDVGVNASPTVLNNIVSGFDTGIRVDASAASQTTVTGGNIFKDNGTPSNFPLGNASYNLDDPAITRTALFVDAANGIYIPASGSLAIDSSFASLPDRLELVNTVKEPSGIGRSPIVAPQVDAFGQPRVDDPTADTPSGVGANVFIDRGALDRADQIGPVASLAVPTDFVAGRGVMTPGGDADETATSVHLRQGTLEYFEFQLLEPRGAGINPATVQSDAVVLTEDGRRLIEGIDYIFGYSATSNTIRLTPLSGIWRPDAAYEITFNNRDRIAIEAPAGAEIVDGEQITVIDSNGVRAVLEFETGFVLDVPQTLTLVIPAGIGGDGGFRDGDQFEITTPGGVTERFELNVFGGVGTGNTEIPVAPTASPTAIRNAILQTLVERAAALDLAPVAVGTREIHLGSLDGHGVNALGSPLQIEGVAGGVSDGDVLAYNDGTGEVRFEFDLVGDSRTAEADVVIPLRRTDTYLQIAAKLAQAFGGTDLDLAAPSALGDGRVHLGGGVGDTLDTSETAIEQTGTPGVTDSLVLAVASAGADGFSEGDQFQITHDGTTTVFEFSFDRDVAAGAEPIRLTAGEGPAAVAARIVDAIRNAAIGLNPKHEGGGRIRLNEPFGYELDLLALDDDPATAPLTASGVPGGAVAIPLVPSPQLSRDEVAEAIMAALNSTPLASEVFAPGGGLVFFSSTTSVEGLDSIPVGAIRDLAGNRLQPNRANDETQFSIFLGAGSDYGDAPEPPYTTLESSGGPRHRIVPGLSLGATVTPDIDGVANNRDADDGVSVIGPVYSGFEAEFRVDVRAENPDFVLDFWVDWNGDGVFDNDPQARERGRMTTATGLAVGLNTITMPVPGVGTAEDGRPAYSVLGETYARFRLSTAGVDGPGGLANDGEVEDIPFTIVVNPFQNPDNRFDVNASGNVSPIDILQVINALNRAGGAVIPLDPNVPREQPPYLDTTGDGQVTPLDALVVLNHIERSLAGGSGEGEAADSSLDGIVDELARDGSRTGSSDHPSAVDAVFGEIGA